ncbi:Hypothetical protein PHPALM_9000 [Phytophthora palmivora]|uniref:Uncharacterized protein n=1 Tax=Phytophthora palmivora TaxID=4796 RepID=A0A2P4Y8G1_9STRA|nr:Hypothetical protein PHPALM_9000 [Phytophthora palmivora]
MDLKQRERRIRRVNEPAPQRPPSIRIKEALRKGRMPVSTGREQDFSSEQASNTPNNAENKTNQPTTENPVVAKGKTTTQQFTSHGVNSNVQETVASLVRVAQLVDGLGPSDDESDSSPPLDSTSFLSPTLPPTLMPTSATCSIKIAQNKKFPHITAAMWMDNHPVHMISTGGSRSLGPVCKQIILDDMLDVPEVMPVMLEEN